MTQILSLELSAKGRQMLNHHLYPHCSFSVFILHAWTLEMLSCSVFQLLVYVSFFFSFQDSKFLEGRDLFWNTLVFPKLKEYLVT